MSDYRKHILARDDKPSIWIDIINQKYESTIIKSDGERTIFLK